MNTPETRLCAHHLTGMSYRDVDLVEDLIGKKTFTEVMIMQILGREARPVDMRIDDTVTMAPPPCARITGASRRVAISRLVTLTRWMRSQSARSMSSGPPTFPMPALACSTSMRP